MPYADPQKRKEYTARYQASHPAYKLSPEQRAAHTEWVKAYYKRCPEAHARKKEQMRQWRRLNKPVRPPGYAQAHREREARRRAENPGLYARYFARPESKAIHAKKQRRLRENPTVRVLDNLRRRVNMVLHGKSKSGRTLQLLGCEVLELKSWLSGWFEPEMTFENYGRIWHIDHNRPCTSFDLSKAEEQRRCFHYLNLRPLFAKDNLIKGAKFPHKETLK